MTATTINTEFRRDVFLREALTKSIKECLRKHQVIGKRSFGWPVPVLRSALGDPLGPLSFDAQLASQRQRQGANWSAWCLYDGAYDTPVRDLFTVRQDH